LPKTPPKREVLPAANIDQTVLKMEKKFEKKESRFRSQIENLIKRVELLYGQGRV